jgi:hypothetical protein
VYVFNDYWQSCADLSSIKVVASRDTVPVQVEDVTAVTFIANKKLEEQDLVLTGIGRAIEARYSIKKINELVFKGVVSVQLCLDSVRESWILALSIKLGSF